MEKPDTLMKTLLNDLQVYYNIHINLCKYITSETDCF